MTGSIRIFEKLNSTPKTTCLVFLKVKLPIYDRLAHTPRTQYRCPHRVLPSVSESQKTECCSRYRKLQRTYVYLHPKMQRTYRVLLKVQKFAADLGLSTPQNSVNPRKPSIDQGTENCNGLKFIYTPKCSALTECCSRYRSLQRT